ncbi:MAG: siderophore-interacting protein [Marmoricola sp.]
MTTQETSAPSVLLTDAEVHSVVRLSPAFVRVELASPVFVDLGEDGFDTRFKVVFPGGTGELPEIPEVAEDWYEQWLGAPDEVRSPMRTYTIRDVVRAGDDVRLAVDFVIHDDDGHGLGPACRWALNARPGDVVQVIAPHRLTEYGGTEFDPAERRHLLLIGDETAVPAIARILEDLRPGYSGHVFIEVPSVEDVLDLHVPPGLEVKWLPRNDDAYGRRLVQEVRRWLDLPPSTEFAALPELDGEPAGEPTSDLDIDVWETPRYSASGEDVEAQLHARSIGHDLEDTYAWIAGESWMVKALRRSLVSELGADRSQVAFMGYWREGVSMKS